MNATLTATDQEGQYAGKATLHAVVDDPELWRQVTEQLQGMELYRGKDFKTELIEVLRRRNEDLEEEAEKVSGNKDEQIERLTQEVGLARAGKVRAEQRVRLLEAQVKLLKGEA